MCGLKKNPQNPKRKEKNNKIQYYISRSKLSCSLLDGQAALIIINHYYCVLQPGLFLVFILSGNY